MKLCQERNIEYSPVEIIQGDIRVEDWLDADIIYLSAVLYSDDLLEKTTARMVDLKKGTRIITLKQLPDRPYLKQYAVIKCK